ncbi:hypothetical protein EV644_1451 [Kribbella orskensis]|uniref:Uncharacterized protein n=1 Tax=Kribbella orskensis TaxID=2512216 RepID=A0ABY2B696_9ACTN|nr:hypothetical protein EV642_1481 [Kribbella sp. VKM Ac-2500]TCO08535.1 hypothetical protein EV644_1451 [Kribbella orskensis]
MPLLSRNPITPDWLGSMPAASLSQTAGSVAGEPTGTGRWPAFRWISAVGAGCTLSPTVSQVRPITVGDLPPEVSLARRRTAGATSVTSPAATTTGLPL